MFDLQKCQSIIAEYLIPRTDAELARLLHMAQERQLEYLDPCHCLVGEIFGPLFSRRPQGIFAGVDKAYFYLGAKDTLRCFRLVPLIHAEFARRFAARYEFGQIEERVQEAARSLTELIDRRRAEEREAELVTA